ncbi:MAG TPA: hypothetical protein VG942_09185 [Hyphomonadaceae bacterium]|nr:hypothetical protein [Hyphomonadaceae bacterium]
MPVEVMFVAIAGMGTFLAMVSMIHRSKMAQIKAGAGSENATRLEQIVAQNTAEVARLRERVQVLEKLVTDDDRRLAGEIERLRQSEARG